MEGMGLCREMFHSNLEWYAMLVLLRGGQYGGLTQQNQNINHSVLVSQRNFIILERPHIKLNTSSDARTVYLAKP